MSGVLDLLPHGMGLRVELDTNETYCGYRLMDAMQAIGEALPGLGCEDAILAVMKEETE